MADSSTGSQTELQRVCLEIDAILHEFMEKLEQYQGCHNKSTNHIKSGYLAFTKARLSTGGIHLKADLTLQPSTAVSCDYMQDTTKNDEQGGKYSHRRVAYDASKAESAERESSSTPTRRRVVHEDMRADSSSSSVEDATSDLKTVQLDEEKPNVTTTIAKPTDPLSAFGFMARNALKPAQTQFNSALSYLIDAADVVQDLLQLERKYQALQIRKKELS